MGGFITVLVLIALFYILWLCMPWIRRKAQQKMAEKVEDYLRSATGMPPREKKKKSRNPFRRQEEDDGASPYGNPRPHYGRRRADEPIIPKEYAEDVEYTEFKSYSSETEIRDDGDNVAYRSQEQVEDAEWIEIKEPKTPGRK